MRVLSGAKLVAYHEAGHAVTASVLGCRVIGVRLLVSENDIWSGDTRLDVPDHRTWGALPHPQRIALVRRQAVITAAGIHAQAIASGGGPEAFLGAEGDLHGLRVLASMADCRTPNDCERFARHAYKRAQRVVRRHARSVCSVGDALIARREVSGRQVETFVREHRPPWWRFW